MSASQARQQDHGMVSGERTQSQKHPWSRRLLPALLAPFLLVLALPAAAGAATTSTYFVAPGGSDAVACSANSVSSPFATIQKAVGCTVDGDVISLAPSGSTPYPGIGTVSDNLVIEAQPGANARSVTIDAGRGELSIAPGAVVTVSGVSLSCITNSCFGLPTVTNQGSLTLSADALTGNQSLLSTILNTTPANSSTPASLTVSDSTIANNLEKTGGAVQSTPGSGATGPISLTVDNSTLANNFAQSVGGALDIADTTPGSSATIINSTITANRASGGGGLYASSPVTVSNTIIAGNTDHTGAQNDCGTTNAAQLNDGPGGHNLIGNGNGCSGLTAGTDGDQVGTTGSPLNPDLGPLAYNGGATETAPPLAGSPVIGAANPGTCQSQPIFGSDQRGESRNAAARAACDVGAADTGGSTPSSTPPSITSAGSTNATVSSPSSFKITANGSPTAALSESGPLPSGVSFTDNGDGTASLAGTAAAGSAGSYPITITASNGVSPAATQAFTLNVATLSAGAVNPISIAQGVKNLAVTVTGSGFEAGATLTSSNPGITFSSVTVKSPGVITAKETATAAVPTGTYDLTVKVPGTTATCSGCLQVLGQPTVSSISPATLGQGAAKVAVTVNGSNFWSPARVSFTGPGSGVKGSVTFVGASTLSVTVTVPATAATGAYTLKLTNGDGGVATCTGCLIVVAGPTITAISPSTVTRAQKTTFTVTGTGFSQDAKLTGPKGVSFSAVSVNSSGTSITATIAIASTAPTGTGLAVTVRDGAAGDDGSVAYSGLTIT